MLAKRPSRYYVAQVYTKRALRWTRNSAPYLSGDAFADLSEVAVFPPKYRGKQPSLREIRSANVIFCPSEHLQHFLDDHKNQLVAKVIIAGNDDTEFHDEPKNLPNSIKRIYLQNSFISDNRWIFTLPIGIENLRYGVNGHPKLMATSSAIMPQPQVLFGPFSPTHDERVRVKESLGTKDGPWKFLSGNISPRANRQHSLSYKWIGAVRGNGIDTHRLWETLYRERFPIIKQDKWSTSLQYLSLPITLIPEWEEQYLWNIIKSDTAQPFIAKDIPQLWIPWWRDQIRKAAY